MITYSVKPLLAKLEYNTVEGLALNAEQRFRYSSRKRKNIYTLDWNTRYGFSNTHLNSYGELTIRSNNINNNIRNRYLKLSGGKRLSQFNRDNPIGALGNSIATLVFKNNYIKLYENWFGRVEYNTKTESGLRLNFHVTYEDRLPVDNSTDFTFFRKKDSLLPNHPYELANIPFARNQALVAGIKLVWQPGQRYIQFPYV